MVIRFKLIPLLLPDLLRGLLNELVIVFVLLGDLRVRVVMLNALQLLFVFRPQNVALQKVTQVRVVVLLLVLTFK